MTPPKVIYLQTCGDCLPNVVGKRECDQCNFDDLGEVTWCQDKINPSDRAYFSEDAVRELLREEYRQCAGIIKKATKVEDLIKIDESVESAITKLKGGNNENN